MWTKPYGRDMYTQSAEFYNTCALYLYELGFEPLFLAVRTLYTGTDDKRPNSH